MARPNDRVTDPFLYLVEDHRAILTIIDALAVGSERAVRAKEELLRDLDVALSLHTEVEEQVLYPALEEVDATRSKTLESFAEHHVVKLTLQELLLMSTGTPEWTAKLTVLKDSLTRHIHEEEDNMFPPARHALGETSVREIGEKMQKFLKRD